VKSLTEIEQELIAPGGAFEITMEEVLGEIFGAFCIGK